MHSLLLSCKIVLCLLPGQTAMVLLPAAVTSCFHANTGYLWVTWTPASVGISIDGRDIPYVSQKQNQTKRPNHTW